ncbi:FAD:protein FMN transferase [Oceanicoccus sp. KOV_DT_Chl]|uniref:FAD:protein FMN transferase n=1 Tax=Oceanicoccus sp. KOV_DT_Chl TaxID=1904639 RepID=UPI001F1DDD6C|nr:FAD:protein FMN transferase [Oceanicoccus sp. KOV_DT_Chl]
MGRISKRLWLLVVISFSSAVNAEWVQRTEAIMGTEVAVELWADTGAGGEQAIEAVMVEMRRIDALMSPYKESSELARLNKLAADKPVNVSTELFSLIEKALWYSRISDGAFDITFASAGQLYDYRAGQRPDEKTLQQAAALIDFNGVLLDQKNVTVSFSHPGMRIDLGGIAKGHAVDRGIAILQQQGIQAAVVSAGGDSRMLGDRGDRPWVIGIKHPRAANEQAVKIPLSNTALSTSGDYERFYIEDGVRYHHILDPRSGKSVEAIQSVSILAPLAVDSDALSTTVFVLGIEKGLALVNRLPGIDAIIIDGSGKLHYSKELLMSGGE